MTDKELDRKIRDSIDALSPEPYAKERVRAKIAEKAEHKARKPLAKWVKLAVPTCLTAVVVLSGIALMRNGALGKVPEETSAETGKTVYALVTEAATEIIMVPDTIHQDIYYYTVGDETITVGGALYRACEPTGVAAETVIGTVAASEKAELVGRTVYETDVAGFVAVMDDDGSQITYRYVGTADGGGTMRDWLAAYGITADSFNRIDLRDQTRDKTETHGEIVSHTMHRLKIKDAGTLADILDALSALSRNQAAYDAAIAETAEPYAGHIRIEILVEEENGGVRQRVDLVYYPAIGYLNGGYRADAAFAELIASLLDGEVQ